MLQVVGHNVRNLMRSQKLSGNLRTEQHRAVLKNAIAQFLLKLLIEMQYFAAHSARNISATMRDKRIVLKDHIQQIKYYKCNRHVMNDVSDT